MKTGKILLLLILGGLAAVAIFFPTAIIMGLFLGVAPGIILTLAPTAFVYYALALLLGIVLKFFKVPFPIFVSLISLIALGCLASFTLNIPIYNKVKEYERKDVALEDNFKVPDTIAIYSKQYTRHKDACNALCQGLLFNKAAQKVLVITDPSVIQSSSNQQVTSYEIKQGSNCTNEYVISKRWGKIAGANVESRIAAGECLVKAQTKISDAEAIFFNDKISLNEGYQKYGSLKRRVVFINYIELLENIGSKFDTIYRYSEISAQPFAYPLSFGHILGGGGGSMSLNFGFFHTKKTVNNPGPSYGNPIQEFKSQMENIFGEALKPIEAAKIDTKKLIIEALDSEGGKIAGHSLVGNHLRKICKSKIAPTNEDLSIVVRALGDDRVDNWDCLNGFSQQWYKKYNSLPQDYLEGLVDRILRKKDIHEASRTILFLPDGEATGIFPKLEQIVQDKVLRERAYGAVIRLGDGGVRAIPYYLQILKEFEMALSDTGHNSRRNKIRELGDAPIASVIGLCRLGEDALPAKEVLFQLLDTVNYRTSISESAIDALIEMGLAQDLEKRYESNEEVLKEIQRSIQQSKRKNRRWCGRRIV